MTKALEELKSHEIEYHRFVSLMQKLLIGVPLEVEEEAEITGKQVEAIVNRQKDQLKKQLQTMQDKSMTEFEKFNKTLQKIADQNSIFEAKLELKFSETLKHHGVEIVSENTVKSIEAYNYHFGLLEPCLSDKGQTATFAFKINQSCSNWLAVGCCYKNIVSSNSFNFNYSMVGHGGYLISSNGGMACITQVLGPPPAPTKIM